MTTADYAFLPRTSNPLAFSQEGAGPGERRRRLVVKLIFLIFWLLIFEGSLRKWVAPQFSKQLFFIRDPFVIAVYVLALAGRVRMPKSPLFLSGMIFAALCFFVMLGHLASDKIIPAYLAFYGWRNYFFYLPLAFVMQAYIRAADLRFLIKSMLIVTIPMAVLVAAESASPAWSPLNAGTGDDPDQMFQNAEGLLEGGMVRTSGTFTNTQGLSVFSVAALALNISMWLLPGSARIIAKPWLVASSGALAVCLGLSGSRGVLVWAGVLLVSAIGGLLITNRNMGVKAAVLTTVLVAAGTFTIPIAFPEATHALVTRWNDANAAESQAYGKHGIFSRAFDELIRFHILIDGTPLFGYGLGSAGNAAWKLGTRELIIPFASEEQLGAAETDWGRNILELGPIAGSLYITYRVIFTFVLGFQALAATRRSANPLPWLLFSYLSITFMYGEVTAHGTINGFMWMFTGFCLAAISGSTKEALTAPRIAYPRWVRSAA